ncbi:hypothetical protein [Clostridium botulinum]|uniref:hypothetical protein n=1 Tax=Clostridium botulinum TaxID=1491 RepID=UPI003DA63C83
MLNKDNLRLILSEGKGHIILIFCWSLIFVASLIFLINSWNTYKMIESVVILGFSIFGIIDHALRIKRIKKSL